MLENVVIPEKPVAYPTPGIVLGQGVRLRKDSTMQAPEIGKVSAGENLELLGATRTLFALSQDSTCDSSPMVQVKTESGAIGWMHGKYVFRVLDNYMATDTLGAVLLNGTEFRLKACRNYTIGAWSDSLGGLTSCWEFYPMLLMDRSTGKYYPVELAPHTRDTLGYPYWPADMEVSADTPGSSYPPYYARKYWNLESDEGGSDLILSIEPVNVQTTRIEMVREPMEGCVHFSIDLFKEDGRFVANCHNIRFKEEGTCR